MGRIRENMLSCQDNYKLAYFAVDEKNERINKSLICQVLSLILTLFIRQPKVD